VAAAVGGLPLGLGDLAYVPRIQVMIPFEPGDARQRSACPLRYRSGRAADGLRALLIRRR